jgi:hypothetical protein
MADNHPKRGEKMRALHHFEGFRASRETPLSRGYGLEMKHPEYAEPDQANEDQVDRDDKVQEPRHDQDQDSRNKRDDGGNVRRANGH